MERSSDSAAVLDIRPGIVSHRLEMRSSFLLACLMAAGLLPAQTADTGRAQFDGHCAVCHGKGGNGGELGPAIVTRLPNYNDGELATPAPHRTAQLRYAGVQSERRRDWRTHLLSSYLEALGRRRRPGARQGRARRRPDPGRPGVQSKLRGHAVAHGRSAHPPAAQGVARVTAKSPASPIGPLITAGSAGTATASWSRFRKAMWRGWRPSGSSRWSTPLRSK